MQTLSNVIQRIEGCYEEPHTSIAYISAVVSQIPQELWPKGLQSPTPLSVVMRALKIQIVGGGDGVVGRVLATPQALLRHLLEDTHLLHSELFWV